MGKVCTRFQTKSVQKTLPDGAGHTYMAYIREYPPPRAFPKRNGTNRHVSKSSVKLWYNEILYMTWWFFAPVLLSPHFQIATILVQEYISSYPPPTPHRFKIPTPAPQYMKPRGRNGELDYFIPTSLYRYSIKTVPKRSLFWVWIVPGDVSEDQWPIDCR